MENKLMPGVRDSESRKISVATKGYHTEELCGGGTIVYFDCGDVYTNLHLQGHDTTIHIFYANVSFLVLI